MSWISLEDEVRALLFAIFDPSLSGPVNMTGPAPVTNAEFTTAFGRALNRPTPLMAPGFVIRAALGEFADEGLLIGQRAIPSALERAGFQFERIVRLDDFMKMMDTLQPNPRLRNRG